MRAPRRGDYMHGFAPRDFRPAYPELWQGCVGAWCPSLGPTGTTLYDWSGAKNNMSFDANWAPSAAWVASSGRYGLESDGSDDFASFTGVATGTTFTFSIWVRPRSQTQNYGLVFGQNNPVRGLYYRGSGAGASAGKLTWYVGSDRLTTATLTNDVWTHAVFTCLAGSGQWYLNGAPDASAASITTLSMDRIGRDSIAGNTSKVVIDDLRLYSRVLSSQEIALLYSRRGIAYEWRPPMRNSTQTVVASQSGVVGGGLGYTSFVACRREA